VPTKSFIAMFLIARSVSKWYPELFLIVSVLIYLISFGVSVKLLSDIIFADTFLWAGVKMLVIGVTYLSITAYYAVILFIKNYSTTADRFPLGSD
jgi:hypothetical protein